jgi:ParB family chromosome partitioning protein
LEARQLAQAALHYARVTKAANDTHADCLRIITRAEMRMATEIDNKPSAQGQRRDLNFPQSLGEVVPTLKELGVDDRRLSEWRELRDAGEEEVERALSAALDEGRTPTRASIQAHVRGTFGTGENEWYTPPQYIEAARQVLGIIDLDPASNQQAQATVSAERFFTKDDDGLTQEWHGRVWLNPPYAQPLIANFVDKMVSERISGRVTAGIMLTHNYTDTAWFHSAASIADAICFTKGRVRFIDSAGGLASPTQGQAFFYFGTDLDAFEGAFSAIGLVVRPYCAG